jgi:hypothetical protein
MARVELVPFPVVFEYGCWPNLVVARDRGYSKPVLSQALGEVER